MSSINATLVKAVGDIREDVRPVVIEDRDQAWEPAFEAAIRSNMKGQSTALTKFLVVDTETGNILAGYFASNLEYTDR